MRQHKSHKKYFVTFTFLAFLLGGIVLLNQKEEKEVLSSGRTLAKVTQVADTRTKYCKAAFIKEHYGSSDQVKTTFSGRTITVTGVPANVKVVAEMTYGVTEGGVEKTKTFDSEAYLPGADGTMTITIPQTYQGNNVYTTNGSVTLYFYPTEKYEDDTRLCDLTDILFYKQPSKGNEQVTNSSYNKDYCVAYRNKYSGVPEMREAVSYCFEATVDADYDEADVKDWIKNAEETYQFKQQALGNNKPLTPDDEHTVTDPSKVGTLSCDAYTPDVFNKDGSVEQYANSKTFNYKKTTYEGTYCRTICKETVTINYQAPIATQAGLCFSYKVEVKSKVECTTESTGVYPKKKQVCVPTADCNGTYDWHHDQAGPQEDFDRCVTSCDGGKYSQKCINSCYSKVYSDGARAKNMGTGMLTYENSAKVTQVADAKCPANSNTIHPTYSGMSAAEVYQFRQKYPGGYYKSLGNGKWDWVPGKNKDGSAAFCPSQVGYYYFSTPELTASTLSGFRSIYIADENGFKRQDSARFYCNSVCTWQASCPSDALQTTKEVNDDYKAQQEAEKADWEKCKQKASCSETTTEYTVTVDKDDKDSPNYKVYEATQKPGGSPSGDTIIEDYSGNCYNKEDGWEYRNVISFPKTYLSVKTGLTTTLKPNNLNHFVYVGNSFCTSTKSEDVNVHWYNWKVYDGGDTAQLTEEKKNKIETNRVDNINVQIGSSKNHLWGLMGWKFDINCFYALVKNPITCDKEDGSGCDTSCSDGKCKDGDQPQEAVQDYLFRAVSLDDMFPPSESSPNGRSPRYNWSCQASNTLNEDYPVQPSTAIANIEAKGNNVYNNDSEVDYEIDLTSSDINKIRAYNKTRKSYLDFEETSITSKTNGVTVYTSNFLTKTLGDSLKKRGIAGCNNQTGDSCDNAIVQDECYNALK